MSERTTAERLADLWCDSSKDRDAQVREIQQALDDAEARVHARYAALVEAATTFLQAEWMVTHDWGGDREAVYDALRQALSEIEEVDR